MEIAARIFAVAADLPLDGRSGPDLGRVLSVLLEDAHLSAGELVLGGHCWRCTPSTSERVEDSGEDGLPFAEGLVRLPGAGPRARKRLLDLLVLAGPVFRVGGAALEVYLARTAAAADGAEIGRLRRAAAADLDAQRRKLERDLHDGAQNELVALKMTLAVLSAQVATGQDVGAAVGQLTERLAESEQNLSRAASGIAPTELHEDGLLAALRASAPPSTRLQFTGDGGQPRRYPAAVEVAAHYIALEAITNALKHAAGAAVDVRVSDSYAGLEFVVADAGPGIDEVAASTSLRFLRDRAAAVGGTLEVTSSPAGTQIRGTFPV